MEKMDALIVTPASGSNKTISPWTECNGFDGSPMIPPMFLGTRSNFFDGTTSSN
jgi:hypothetical protein